MPVLYETLIDALQSEEFHHSLWPGAIPRSGHAGYKKIDFPLCLAVLYFQLCLIYFNLTTLGFSMDFKAMAFDLGFGEKDFLELVELLVTVSLSDLSALEQGLAQGSGQKIAQAAHSIKGAAGNLGFVEIAAMAEEIESLANRGDLHTIKARAEILRQGFFSIKEVIFRS